jgi:hypothetical protein
MTKSPGVLLDRIGPVVFRDLPCIAHLYLLTKSALEAVDVGARMRSPMSPVCRRQWFFAEKFFLSLL